MIALLFNFSFQKCLWFFFYSQRREKDTKRKPPEQDIMATLRKMGASRSLQSASEVVKKICVMLLTMRDLSR
jgi:hypothetical protein